RHWAEAKNFEFLKSDEYLEDEWFRGAASNGASPRDIVVGNVFGHEMLLMDLGGVNVMAMRTGSATEEVIDFRRRDALEQESSEDLFEAFSHDDFIALATDTAVAQRMRDIRVNVALERMPHDVTGIWMESEWVLAQTTKNALSPVWEEMLAPLAVLADAARTLPPRPSTAQALRDAAGDPPRHPRDQWNYPACRLFARPRITSSTHRCNAPKNPSNCPPAPLMTHVVTSMMMTSPRTILALTMSTPSGINPPTKNRRAPTMSASPASKAPMPPSLKTTPTNRKAPSMSLDPQLKTRLAELVKELAVVH